MRLNESLIRRGTLGVTSCLLWLVLTQVVSASDIKSLREAWNVRQARVKSAFFEWNAITFYPAESQIARDGRRGPAKDTTVNNITRSLRLMGPKLFKYSFEGKRWISTTGLIDSRSYTSAYTGTVFKQLHAKHGLAEVAGPMGYIGNENADSNNRYLLPLLIHFRPFDQGVADLADAEYIAKAGTIGKTKCAIVRYKAAGGRFECWVDPARDYLVMRILKKQRRTDISYVRNKVVGWIPQSWSIRVMNSDGSLRESKKATVRTNLTLINSGVKKSDFDIVFPDATYVTDRSKAEIATYIARANGARRVITREERSVSVPYKVLIKTKGPEETIGAGVLPKK